MLAVLTWAVLLWAVTYSLRGIGEVSQVHWKDVLEESSWEMSAV